MKGVKVICLLLVLLPFHFLRAQRSFDPMVKVVIGPDHTNWVYKRGEKAQFHVTIMLFGNALNDVPISYEIGPERMKPVKKDSLVLKKGTIDVDGGTMNVPGFLRCRVVAKVDRK